MPFGLFRRVYAAPIEKSPFVKLAPALHALLRWKLPATLPNEYIAPNLKPLRSLDRNLTELGSRSPLKRSKSPWWIA